MVHGGGCSEETKFKNAKSETFRSERERKIMVEKV